MKFFWFHFLLLKSTSLACFSVSQGLELIQEVQAAALPNQLVMFCLRVAEQKTWVFPVWDVTWHRQKESLPEAPNCDWSTCVRHAVRVSLPPASWQSSILCSHCRTAGYVFPLAGFHTLYAIYGTPLEGIFNTEKNSSDGESCRKIFHGQWINCTSGSLKF